MDWGEGCGGEAGKEEREKQHVTNSLTGKGPEKSSRPVPHNHFWSPGPLPESVR